ncbi:polysaccharide deacetylase family protein [Micromonospora sp. NPDC049559]|uniref:polysaccharide deacetylase family protein n=1 Tax=Micromonospora sp. NPDC049559 TaxID=3155923 RepID=UPI0034464828
MAAGARGQHGTDGYGHGYQGPRRPGPSRQLLGLVALVAVTLLGAAFAIGQTFGRRDSPEQTQPLAAVASSEPAPPASRPDLPGTRSDLPGSRPDLPGTRSDLPGRDADLPRTGRAAEPVRTPGERPGEVPAPPPADPDMLPGPDDPPAGRVAPSAPSNPRPNAESAGTDPLYRLGAEPDGPAGSWQTTGAGYVALTFDDGPSPEYTPQTLALLRRYQVKATFCLIGENVEQHPELVREIVAEGHTLCNHSWSHDLELGHQDPEEIEADLRRTSEAIESAAPGTPIAYFRQPGGNWTTRVVEVAGRLGMTSLGWAVDPQDWRLPGPESIVHTVTSETGPGSIVLLHDGGGDRTGTLDALRWMLPELTERFRLAALPVDAEPPR